MPAPSRRPLPAVWQRGALVAATLLGCAPEFDAPRLTPPPQSMGAHLYQALCERLVPAEQGSAFDLDLCRSGAPLPASAGPQLQALRAFRPRLLQAVDAAFAADAALQDDLVAALPTFLDALGATELQVHARAAHRGLEALRQEPDFFAAWAADAAQKSAEDSSLPALALRTPAWRPLAAALLRRLGDPAQPAALAWARLQTELTTQLQAGVDLSTWAPLARFFLYGKSTPQSPARLSDGSPAMSLAATPLAAALAQLQLLLQEAPDALPSGLRLLDALLQPQGAGAAPALLPQILEVCRVVRANVAPSLWTRARAALLRLGSEQQSALAQLADLQLPAFDAAPAAPEAWRQPLLDWLAQAARVPGLLEDVAAAFADPRVQGLGELLAQQLSFVDGIDFDRVQLNGPPVGAYRTPVNRAAPPFVGNQSVFSRLLWLVHDSRQPLCNPPFAFVEAPYMRCEFFHVPDAAAFYLQAMVGQAHLTLRFFEEDEAMREMLQECRPDGASAVLGFDHAYLLTPSQCTLADAVACAGEGGLMDCATFRISAPAASRMLFAVHDPAVQEEALGGTVSLLRQISEDMQVGGRSIGQVHPATLFAWEKDDFAARVAPLVAAFVDHGRGDLLLDLLGLLHRNWRAGAQLGDGEEGMADLLGRQQGLRALGEVVAALQASGEDGTTDLQALVAAARPLLLPTTGSSLAKVGAGGGPLPTAPCLLRRAWDLSDRASAAVAAAQPEPGSTAARTTEGALPSRALWLGTQATAAGGRAFVNQQAYRLALAALADGGAAETELVGSPPAAAATPALLQQGVELGLALLEDDEVRAALPALLDALLSDGFESTLQATARLLGRLQDDVDRQPLWHALSAWVAPHGSPLSLGLPALQRLWAVDARGVLPRLLAALHRPLAAAPTSTPYAVGVEIWQQLMRREPGGAAPLGAEDYAQLVDGLQAFLRDPEFGVARLTALLQLRPPT